MPDLKARAWAQRLMRGDIRDGDLQGLFLYARDRPDGRDVVTEIGDFAAHHTERQKGMITKTARDWLSTVRYHSVHNFGNGPLIPINKLPSVTPRYISAMFDRLDDKSYRTIGLRRASAFKMRKQVLNGLRENGDGTFRFESKGEDELGLFKLACNTLMITSAFNGSRLAASMLDILRSASLISKEEIKSSPHLSDLFQMYALSVMHSSRVMIEEAENLRLELSQGESGLIISAAVALPIMQGRISIAAPMFDTTLSAPQFCEPDLLFNMQEDRSIEVKASGLLGFID